MAPTKQTAANPFGATANPFGDYFKTIGADWKAAPMDFSRFFQLQRRNIEAITAANQVMIEGAQAITKRQSELMRDHVESFLRTSKDIMTSASPETNQARQSEFTKSMYETALGGAREISEMASKSSFEAFDLLNKRAAESLEEISSAAKKAA